MREVWSQADNSVMETVISSQDISKSPVFKVVEPFFSVFEKYRLRHYRMNTRVDNTEIKFSELVTGSAFK